jgi:5-methylcytosine-specific restriction endonuclease McrBC GTP-binding regulatory subunit McrB
MNSSDRSIALMDLALRRRFHFVEMQPRAEVLLGWLQANRKPRVFRDLFNRLNEALRKAGIGEERLIGHAHFMSPHLDEGYLRLIWDGTIEPLLKEYFFAEPEKLADFQLEKFQSVFDEAAAVEEDAVEEDEDSDDIGDDETEQ